MNYIVLDDIEFTLLDDGIEYADLSLTLRFILGESTLEEVESYAKNMPEILNIYSKINDLISGTFKGYTELYSIKKLVDYPVEDTYTDVIELVLNRPEDVWFYVTQIRKNKMTLDDVPQRLRESVERALEY